MNDVRRRTSRPSVTTVVLGAALLRERPGWLPGAGVVGVLVGVGLVTAFGGA
jgi:drug/metabolite transporter (DMT)-like permease